MTLFQSCFPFKKILAKHTKKTLCTLLFRKQKQLSEKQEKQAVTKSLILSENHAIKSNHLHNTHSLSSSTQSSSCESCEYTRTQTFSVCPNNELTETLSMKPHFFSAQRAFLTAYRRELEQTFPPDYQQAMTEIPPEDRLFGPELSAKLNILTI